MLVELFLGPFLTHRHNTPPLDRIAPAYPGLRRINRTCEHAFVRPAGSPHAVFQRALKNGNLWVAEAEARDMQRVGLEDALKLEKEPMLSDAKVVRNVEERRLDWRATAAAPHALALDRVQRPDRTLVRGDLDGKGRTNTPQPPHRKHPTRGHLGLEAAGDEAAAALPGRENPSSGFALAEPKTELELLEQHEIRAHLLGEVERLAPSRGAEDVEAVVAQLPAEVLARLRLELRDEDCRHARDASPRARRAPDVLCGEKIRGVDAEPIWLSYTVVPVVDDAECLAGVVPVWSREQRS